MATTPMPQHRFRDTRVSRFLQARWRLLFATLVCVALIVFLPNDYRLVTRLLMGWDAGVALYLALVVVMIVRSAPDRLRRDSAMQARAASPFRFSP